MKHLTYIFVFVFLFSFHEFSAQNTSREKKENTIFTVRGEVKSYEKRTPIPLAVIRIIGGEETKTNSSGQFTIRTRLGDQLIIEHPSFGREYHMITSDERIEVLVQGYDEVIKEKTLKREGSTTSHRVLLDSAVLFKKKDIDKSIQYVEKSLENLYDSSDDKKLSDSYAVLGDIYVYWKQYDLAISNYRIALNTYSTSSLWIAIGTTQLLNKEYDEAITSFQTILRNNLSRYQQTIVYEGLGDAYKALKEYDKALENYNKGLAIAQEDLITPKITDLNSKIGENYAAQGKIQTAKGYFSNSLSLAKKQNEGRAIVEQNRVADFYNTTNSFDKEIELRKQNLEDLEKSGIEEETLSGTVADSTLITSQKINYKIGNAFLLQEKYDEAIPYFEKSISEAGKKEDLIIKKDATRKLSESLENIGDFDQAKKVFEEYVEVVNELVLKREQEISQASRFAKRIQDNQLRIRSLEADRELREARIKNNIIQKEFAEETNQSQKYTIYSLIFAISLLVFTIYLLYRNSKQQKLANNLLALKSLRTQMNPHFIFNALNSVNNYIAINDERNANRYLSEFSTLMRAVLENSDEDFIPLSKELELLELYLRLEHMRFQDKFEYTIVVDENVKVSDFQIPPMLLQPYIENAIWHGLRYKEEKGMLNISIFKKDDGMLQITIEDDGIGRKRSMELKTKNQLRQKSKGMGNIKKRIAILNDMYKDKVDVTIADLSADGQGTKVILTLKKD
ncbi:tetratricopeptide repeat-containing sensor histidine kinase [Kordia jejudonensis]|uniref:tetratricopeptide repeat-containing sensor histidine kinase n=1 Tax=Kordia jejudonensis TaxID=1348245 RepID=UPI0006299C71|nr:histidine kinase [Kordia jejudonensis]